MLGVKHLDVSHCEFCKMPVVLQATLLFENMKLRMVSQRSCFTKFRNEIFRFTASFASLARFSQLQWAVCSW